jgi:hypothetical protein
MFFYFIQLIANCKIFPTWNSLLIYKCEEKSNVIMINKNIKYLLQLQLNPCYYVDLVATKSKNGQNIVGL